MPVSDSLPDECMYNEDIAEDNDAEWNCADDNESYPRPDVHLEVAVLGSRSAADTVKVQLRRAVVALSDSQLRTACPQNVEILSNGDQQRRGGNVLGPPRQAYG